MSNLAFFQFGTLRWDAYVADAILNSTYTRLFPNVQPRSLIIACPVFCRDKINVQLLMTKFKSSRI